MKSKFLFITALFALATTAFASDTLHLRLKRQGNKPNNACNPPSEVWTVSSNSQCTSGTYFNSVIGMQNQNHCCATCPDNRKLSFDTAASALNMSQNDFKDFCTANNGILSIDNKQCCMGNPTSCCQAKDANDVLMCSVINYIATHNPLTQTEYFGYCQAYTETWECRWTCPLPTESRTKSDKTFKLDQTIVNRIKRFKR